jgi:hypothetical protein
MDSNGSSTGKDPLASHSHVVGKIQFLNLRPHFLAGNWPEIALYFLAGRPLSSVRYEEKVRETFPAREGSVFYILISEVT